MQTKIAKKIFTDNGSNSYIELTQAKVAYSKLISAFDNSFKIILLYGVAGSGKSYLLNKFFQEYHQKKNIFFYPLPTFKIDTSLADIFLKLTNNHIKTNSLDEVIYKFRGSIYDEVYIILDEANLYDDKTVEWIRVLSDIENLRFIMAFHTIDGVLDLKECFRTRVFEMIEFKDLNLDETKYYIQTKLLDEGLISLNSIFSSANFNKIYKVTNGNLRKINILMYRLIEYIELNPMGYKTIFGKLRNRYIEICAIDLKLI